MLRAEELMVGDYLTFRDALKDNNLVTIKVVIIYGVTNEILASVDGDPTLDRIDIDDELCGIPITPEILEKNGFIKDEVNEHQKTYHLLVPTGFEKSSHTIKVTLYTKPICGVNVLFKCWGFIPPYNGGLNDIHLCSILFVHQMQHALRLCGIDKTIEL